jgi:hypothetical protein
MPCARFSKDCILQRPSVSDSVVNRGLIYSVEGTHVNHVGGRFSNRYDSGIGFVPALFEHTCPAAVFRSVALHIVDPLQREAGKSVAHVCVKVLKFQPPLTDRNSAPTISVVSRTRRNRASLNHCPPRAIGRTARLAMFSCGCRSSLHSKAAAGRCVSRREVTSNCHLIRPALTHAKPLPVRVAVWSPDDAKILNNRKPSYNTANFNNHEK